MFVFPSISPKAEVPPDSKAGQILRTAKEAHQQLQRLRQAIEQETQALSAEHEQLLAKLAEAGLDTPEVMQQHLQSLSADEIRDARAAAGLKP